MLQATRLHEDGNGAEALCLHEDRRVWMAGDEDNLEPWGIRPNSGEQFQAIHAWHSYIREYQVVRHGILPHQVQGLPAIGRRLDLISLEFQGTGQDLTRLWAVIDHEDEHPAGRQGIEREATRSTTAATAATSAMPRSAGAHRGASLMRSSLALWDQSGSAAKPIASKPKKNP